MVTPSAQTTQATETRQETAKRLDNLGITLATLVPEFLRYEGIAYGAESSGIQKSWLEQALKYLERTEDAIKRFREGSPQQFEEEPSSE